MRRKLLLNTITSLLLQVVVVVSGFILPRIRLSYLGSDVNGLIQSISQFLSVITLMELGVGQVIQSSLYGPLASRDFASISRVITSGGKFFRKIAYMMAAYVIVLMFIYPLFTDGSFAWIYISTLIAAMCISSFAQYYFGIIDGILLSADQSGYVHYSLQIMATILNAGICSVMIIQGVSIQIVMLVGSLIHLLRPICARLYIKKHYQINRKIPYDADPLPQKWNGIAQHISAYVLNGTDVMVLTCFSDLGNVSVYSVHNLITNGVHMLYRSMTAGLHSMFGELWAKQDREQITKTFELMELGLHFFAILMFTCTGVLINPFVCVYTNGITDVSYDQPAFAILLTVAYGLQCIRTVYNIPILAGGHYKQTQSCHIIAAVLNLSLSIVAVFLWGLIGVAIGTVVAIAFQVIWMAVYTSKHLLQWPLLKFIKQICVDGITVTLIVLATCWIGLPMITYLGWFIMAVQVFAIACVIVLLMSLVFYGKKIKRIYQRLLDGKVK